MELEIAAKYPTVEQFDGDLGSYLRWQFGIYASFGMSYEEFWEKDYRLVESYVKKHDLDIERETASNWELVTYLRMIMFEELVITSPSEKGKPKPKFDFPNRPTPRNKIGIMEAERQKLIAQEIKEHVQQIMRNREEKSDGND